MDITIKSERVQELNLIVEEHYKNKIIPTYLKQYGKAIIPVINREIEEMKQYLIYEYVMDCLKNQEPEVDTEYLN